MMRYPPPAPVLERHARHALEEDLGSGDLTTDLLIPRDATARATLVSRADGVACGLDLAEAVFRVAAPAA